MSICPTSVATDSDLFIQVNYPVNATTLSSPIDSAVTTIPLTSSADFPTAGGFVTIDQELIKYTGISSNNLTGCTRGVGGSTNAAHLITAIVTATIVAEHHNANKDEIKAIETSLNLTASKVAITDSNGRLSTSSVTPTTLSYLDATSSLQTQLNGKAPSFSEGNLSEVTSSILTITGGSNAVIGSGTSIQVTKADSTHSGYLNSTDWGTFNGKLTPNVAITPATKTKITYDISGLITSGVDATRLNCSLYK